MYLFEIWLTWSGTGIVDPAGIFDPIAAGVGTHTLTYTYGTGTCQKTDNKTIFVDRQEVVARVTANQDEFGVWHGDR